MFVSSLSEVDFILSQVNILLSEVNKKLDDCPEDSRSAILPRVYHIVSELEWTMSLSKGGSECGDDEEENCTYSGALSPPPSSDTESLTWDNFEENFYKLYYDENAEDEDIIERKYDDDDHGPIQFSTSSHDELSDDDENNPDLKVEQDEDVTDVQTEDGCGKFVKEMSEKIDLLASGGKYKVVRPIKYTIDFTRVNKFFMRNIPTPTSFPIHGCSQDPEFYVRQCRNQYGEYPDLKPNHYKDCPRPHGYLYGYETDIGIVPVPEEAVNGYVWKNGSWILHAVADDGVNSRPSWSPPRRRG